MKGKPASAAVAATAASAAAAAKVPVAALVIPRRKKRTPVRRAGGHDGNGDDDDNDDGDEDVPFKRSVVVNDGGKPEASEICCTDAAQQPPPTPPQRRSRRISRGKGGRLLTGGVPEALPTKDDPGFAKGHAQLSVYQVSPADNPTHFRIFDSRKFLPCFDDVKVCGDVKGLTRTLAALRQRVLQTAEIFDAPCEDCDVCGENWICLHCGKVLCGRFTDEAHMKAHHEATGHNVCMGTTISLPTIC